MRFEVRRLVADEGTGLVFEGYPAPESAPACFDPVCMLFVADRRPGEELVIALRDAKVNPRPVLAQVPDWAILGIVLEGTERPVDDEPCQDCIDADPQDDPHRRCERHQVVH